MDSWLVCLVSVVTSSITFVSIARQKQVQPVFGASLWIKQEVVRMFSSAVKAKKVIDIFLLEDPDESIVVKPLVPPWIPWCTLGIALALLSVLAMY